MFRRAKSEAALQGRRLKDFLERGWRLVVDRPRREEKPDLALPKSNPRPTTC